MKNSDYKLKQLFYEQCKNKVYIPSVFIDEIWDYLMSTVGEYVGTTSLWEDFTYVARNLYGDDIERFQDDLHNISNDLIKLLTKGYDKVKISDEEFSKYHKTTHFNQIENGTYLTLDLKNAHIQALLYFGGITEEELNGVFEKYTFGNTLRNHKWVYNIAYQNTPQNKMGFLFDKKLINLAFESNDALFMLVKEHTNTYDIIGDRLFIKIKEKDKQIFEQYLYKHYTTVNDITFFVDICHKLTIKIDNFKDIYVDESEKSKKKFYSNLFKNSLSYDIYPQVYKKIKNLPIEKYDLVYGYCDKINFFKTKIWEV